jgi:hypothetical protein
MPRLVPYAIVSRLLGVLLLAAAALKLFGFGVDTVSTSGIFSDPSFQAAIILFEGCFGLLLLTGKAPIASWLLGLLTFTAFAVVSLRLALIGQATCASCFGPVLKVNPWISFIIDMSALTLLLLGRPDLKPVLDNPRAALKRFALMCGAGVGSLAVIFGALVGIAYLGFGSVDDAIAKLRGERISIRPRVVDIGEVAVGESREIEIDVLNRNDHAIRLIGGTAD